MPAGLIPFPVLSVDLPTIRRPSSDLSARQLVAWARDRFGDGVVASSSFQSQSLPLLHILSEIDASIPVIFLDTGFHFPETLRFRDEVVERFGLNLLIARAEPGGRRMEADLGPEPYRLDPDRCCAVNKIAPMRRALKPFDAWISGIRADQTRVRANARTVERGEGLWRVHPMLAWSDREVWSYIHQHDLPEHPLMKQGYLSVGCAPCTEPALDESSSRSGRWTGTSKTECGLHTDIGRPGGSDG